MFIFKGYDRDADTSATLDTNWRAASSVELIAGLASAARNSALSANDRA